MAEDDTIGEGVLEQLVQKFTPCIERGELDACVEKAARLAVDIEIRVDELLDLVWQLISAGKYEFVYVLALGVVDELDDCWKTMMYFSAGFSAQSIGDMRKAETYYLKAIKAEPKLAIPYNHYANLLNKLNRKDEAESNYLKAIEADSNYAAAHNNYGTLLNELNRIDEAEIYYLKAIEANPKFALAHSNYAKLLHALNRDDDAESHCIKSIQADPKLATAHNNYANLLRKRGKFSEAEEEVEIALQIAQDDFSSQDILPYAHGTLGDIHADEADYRCAEREYQKALDKSNSMNDSAISQIRNNLGWVYTQMGKSDKAEKEFKKACSLDPMNIKAKRNLRALARRRERKPDDMSAIQIFLGSTLLLLLILTYVLFVITKLSEASFVTQSTIFLLLIFVLFDIISKFKFDKNGLEVERSIGHMYMPAKASVADVKSIFKS